MTDSGTPSELSELALSGITLPGQVQSRVGFSVRHVKDGSGVLADLLTSPGGADIDELVASAAYGSGYVLSLRRGDVRSVHGRDRAVVADIQVSERDGVEFVGGGNPNPSFLYEGTEAIDLLVVLDPERVSVTRVDGLLLADVLRAVSDIIVRQRAPILSLISPVQLPRVSNSSNDENDPRRERWRRPSGFGIRFSVGLRRSAGGRRLELLDDLRRYCAERGLGLWLGDRRPGFRSGNWFRILPHSRPEFREFAEGFQTANHAAIGLLLPVTAIGPARVGTTRAIVTALATAGVPIVGVTATALQDTAFIHLQVALPVGGPEIASARDETRVRGIVDVLAYVQRLAGRGSPAARELGATGSVVPDYIGLVGGAVAPRFSSSKSERVLWAAWEVPAAASAGSSSTVALLESLDDALAGSGMVPGAPPSVEYLTVRRSARDRLRCRCKLSVDSHRIYGVSEGDHRRAVQEFCQDAEQRLRERLLAADPSGTSDASVGWRESWLGRWSSTLM